ncbi:MAG: hypothetical protein ABIG96_02505 [Candidatus Micrarchaeota archaeon]
MNPLTLILMAFFAYFFYSIGSTFLAFLVLVVAIVFALSSSQQPAASGHGGAAGTLPGGVQPIVIQSGQPAAAFPRKFEFRPNFPGDPDGDEWISGKLGAWVVLFGKILGSLFGGGTKQEKSR